MKKLVLLLAVAFSASLFSCGNGDKTGNNDSDSVAATDTVAALVEETVTVDSAAVDSAAVDTTVNQ